MDLLERLAQTAAIPGREHRIRELIRREITEHVDDIRTDALGSLIAVRKARPRQGAPADRPPRIMLAAHMDQIGFMVRHIDDRGFIRIQAVGGFDNRNLFARLCTICPDLTDPGKDITGVLNPAGKPIHIASDDDRKKIPEIHEFIVDLGIAGDEVKERVRIGDMVVLRAPFAEIGQTVVAQSLDNRVACWMLIRALQALEHHDSDIHAVFTVQEEVGLRGAGAAAFGIDADFGIAVDTTLCVDTPGVPDDQRVTQQAAGATLTVMDGASIADLSLLDRFEQLAQEHEIQHQRSVLPRGGTDAGTMQRAGAGLRTFTLSCPTRYIHTVCEMVHRDDLHACRDLLLAFLHEGPPTPDA
ncbi:MAG: M20/M25/M40 family metallo-hydrolase [Phycisphaeraceae bacterium]